MRECGGCTLCCKLERIEEIVKPGNQYCQHCKIGVGCGIYETRYTVCRTFKCLWLTTDIPELLRPDKAHLYAVDVGSCIKVVVDQAHPDAWRAEGAPVVTHFTSLGRHVLVMCGNQLTFICGLGQPVPKKIIVDWTLSL